MVLFNYSTKELTAKVVYYGPGLCGKTTNLQFIHKNLSDNVRGKMLSLATKTDRTLFFDFLPMDLGEIRGMKTRMQLYTVPGQVFYNETRKLVLKGVDGIVFVADSQEEMVGANTESFKNLEENLKTHGVALAELPHVIQFNKRDLPKLAGIEELNAALNKYNAPFYESVATTGIGVQDTLKAITKLVLLNLTKKYDPRTAGKAAARTAVAAPPPPAAGGPGLAVPPPPGVPRAGDAPPPPVIAAALDTPSVADAPAVVPSDPMPPVEIPPPVEVSPADVAAVEAPPVALTPPEQAPEPSLAAPPAADEIDMLVDEVQDAQPEASAGTGDPAPLDLPMPPSPSTPDQAVDAATARQETLEDLSVKLTEVVEDNELFDDPSLEVAQLDAGTAREIVIPVQIGREGTEVRRFKLSLSLRLDPVD